MAKNKVQVDDSPSPETSAVNMNSTRKRPNVDNQLEKTTTKRRRYSESVANSSALLLKDEMEDKSSAEIKVPTEILEAILQNVATSDLLKCRQVNSSWSEISSHVLRKRADVQLRFGFEKGHFLRLITYRHCEELLMDVCGTFERYDTKSLSDLVDCLNRSQNFPFTNFRFDGSMINFGNEDMRSFLSIWGENVIALAVMLDNPSNNVGILRDLLLVNAVNLKKLEIRSQILKATPSTDELFVDLKGLQLPKLEILCVDSEYGKFARVVRHILAAASNLKQFELLRTSNRVTPEILAMLQTFNKLNCLKNAEICLEKDLVAYWQKSPNYSKLRLRSLHLEIEKSVFQNRQLTNSATEIINQLLRSSWNVMETFSIDEVDELRELAIPKLEKLQKFELLNRPYSALLYFPGLLEMADNFPNLKELVLYDLYEVDFSPSQPKLMLSLETLRFVGGRCAEGEENLMKATPNVKTLVIQEASNLQDSKFHIDFRAIAKYLPRLESIGLQIYAFDYRKMLHSLDAQMTGFPENDVRAMLAEFRNRDHLTRDEVASYQLQRQNSSLVDMKELKRLDVDLNFRDCPSCSNDEYLSECERTYGCVEAKRRKKDAGGFDVDSNLYETGLTKVTKFLAFDLMPRLKVRIHKTVS